MWLLLFFVATVLLAGLASAQEPMPPPLEGTGVTIEERDVLPDGEGTLPAPEVVVPIVEEDTP